MEENEFYQNLLSILQKHNKSLEDIQQIQAYLSQISIFSCMFFKSNQNNIQLCNKIIQNLKLISFKKHNTLSQQTKLYNILLKGSAYSLVPITESSNKIIEDILIKQTFPTLKCIKIYKPGDSLGEKDFFTEEQNKETVVCVEDSIFLSLNKEGFDIISSEHQKQITNERYIFLREFDFFLNISATKLSLFLQQVEEINCKFQQIIYFQGDAIQKIYFIIKGNIEIIKKVKGTSTPKCSKYFANQLLHAEKRIVLLGPNMYFGDEDFYNPAEKRQFKALSVSFETKLLAFDLQSVVQLLKNNGSNFQIFKHMCLKKYQYYNQNTNTQTSKSKLLNNLPICNYSPKVYNIYCQNANKNISLKNQYVSKINQFDSSYKYDNYDCFMYIIQPNLKKKFEDILKSFRTPLLSKSNVVSKVYEGHSKSNSQKEGFYSEERKIVSNNKCISANLYQQKVLMRKQYKACVQNNEIVK